MAQRGKGGAGRGRGRGGNSGGRGKKKAEEVKIDEANVVSMKGGSKISFCGGSIGNGDSLAPFIITDKGLSEEIVQAAPKGTVLVGDPPRRQEAQYTITKGGGMTDVANVAYINSIIQPALACQKGVREGILGVDGFGSHHSIKVVRAAQAAGLKIALRFPHGSRLIQGPDTDNFPLFARRFDLAKSDAQVAKFKAARALAMGEGRRMTSQEVYDASQLSEGEWLQCAIQPWEDAFDAEVNVRALRHEGIVPFTRKVAWDLLKKEQSAGKTAAPVTYSDQFYNAFGYTKEQAASIGAGPSGAVQTRAEEDVDLGSDGINEDAEAMLEAEAITGPKSRLPRVTSGDLFKLGGSATGKIALNMIRQKAVEKRAAELKKARSKDSRLLKAQEERRSDLLASTKLLQDLCNASDAATALASTNKPELISLLRLHGKMPPEGKTWTSWKKPEVLNSVRELLKTDGVGDEDQRAKLVEAAGGAVPAVARSPAPAPAAAAPRRRR